LLRIRREIERRMRNYKPHGRSTRYKLAIRKVVVFACLFLSQGGTELLQTIKALELAIFAGN